MAASNSVPWPATLPEPLVGPPRSIQPRSEITSMESKRIRVRPMHADHLEILEFEWNFTADEFEIFKAFFEEDLENGSYPFEISFMDPDDSNQDIVIDYGFFEGTYQWARSDNLFTVYARMVVEEEVIEQREEPFPAGLCGVIIWPAVSDGEGGGNTFECYTVGADYSEDQMEAAGTGITVVYNHENPNYPHGEDFESFAIGDLVLGSPSVGSHLLVMYYGDSPFGSIYGDNFESYSLGAFADGTPPVATNLSAFYVG